MINFTIDQISNFVDYVKKCYDSCNSAYSSNVDICRSVIRKAKQIKEELESSIDNARSDLDAIYQVQTHNSFTAQKARGARDHGAYVEQCGMREENEAKKAAGKKEYEEAEATLKAIDEAYYQLNILSNQVNEYISTYSDSVNELAQYIKELDNELSSYCTDMSSYLSDLKSIKDKATRAYNTVNGVFTSCKLENTSVLAQLLEQLTTFSNIINNNVDNFKSKIAGFSEDLQNVDFADKMVDNCYNVVEKINDKNKMDKHISKLELYIKVLERYLGCA